MHKIISVNFIYCVSLDVHPKPNYFFPHLFLKSYTFENKFQGSRRVSGKALIKDCISVMCMCHVYCGTADDLLCFKNSSEDKLKNCSSAATIALPEIEKCLCTAMQKLLLMVHLLTKLLLLMLILVYDVLDFFRSWILMLQRRWQIYKVLRHEQMVPGIF